MYVYSAYMYTYTVHLQWMTVALACSNDIHNSRFLSCTCILYTVMYDVQLFFITFVFFHSLEELYFLECDVGQSEFTPPGLISLNRVCTPLLGRLLLKNHFNGIFNG